jgi:hypothetical protein
MLKLRCEKSPHPNPLRAGTKTPFPAKPGRGNQTTQQLSTTARSDRRPQLSTTLPKGNIRDRSLPSIFWAVTRDFSIGFIAADQITR